MAGLLQHPPAGAVFVDERGEERSLRVTWHPEAGDDGLVVLSLWRGGVCVATFRLDAARVADLVQTLRAGLVDDSLRHDRVG